MPELTHSEAERLLDALEGKRQDAIDRGDLDELRTLDRRIDAIQAAMDGEVVRYPDVEVMTADSRALVRPGEKNNVAAGVLAILLGGFGVHKFYLGKNGQGLLYLLFFWTMIPALFGLVEGIRYLVADPDEFALKYT